MRGHLRERYFVVSDRPMSLQGVIKELAPGDVRAFEEGRVFVDGQRVFGPLCQVNTGSKVTWYAPRSSKSTMGDVEFRILERRDDFLIAAKPASWSSEPDRSGCRTSLRERVASHLGVNNLHVATRLDVGVSGLALIALSKSARQKAANFQDLHQIKKEYLAVVLGTDVVDAEWDGFVDGTRRALTLIRVLGSSGLTRFVSQREGRASLLHVMPVTGHHHQIRVHAADRGHPLMGDKRYGGPTQVVKGDGTVLDVSRPMLHAWRLSMPWADHDWVTVCPVPGDMRRLWADLDGVDCWPES